MFKSTTGRDNRFTIVLEIIKIHGRGDTCGKEPTCYSRSHERCRFNPWFRKIPWRRKRLPTPVFLPWEFHGRKSLAGYSLQGLKELDMTEWLTLSLSSFFMVQEITSQRFDPSIWHSVKAFASLRTNLILKNSICYLPPSNCYELKAWISPKFVCWSLIPIVMVFKSGPLGSD